MAFTICGLTLDSASPGRSTEVKGVYTVSQLSVFSQDYRMHVPTSNTKHSSTILNIHREISRKFRSSRLLWNIRYLSRVLNLFIGKPVSQDPTLSPDKFTKPRGDHLWFFPH